MPNGQKKANKSPQSQFIPKGLLVQTGASLVALLIYSLVIALFGIDTEGVNQGHMTAAGLLGTVLLCMMIYSLGWRVGNRDQNLVRYGHIPYAPRRALYGYAASQIPGLVVTVLAVLVNNRVISLPWVIPVTHFLYFPFVWLFNLTGAHTLFLTYLIPFVVLPPFCHWGYYNGYRFVSLWHQIVYKGQKGTVKNRAVDRRLR